MFVDVQSMNVSWVPMKRGTERNLLGCTLLLKLNTIDRVFTSNITHVAIQQLLKLNNN